jgi:hypothetical protein
MISVFEREWKARPRRRFSPEEASKLAAIAKASGSERRRLASDLAAERGIDPESVLSSARRLKRKLRRDTKMRYPTGEEK